jgi:dihydroflavonol-4-reductase
VRVFATGTTGFLGSVVADLADPDALKRGCDGCDAVVHAGAIYEVGIAASRRIDMYEANVNGTERVLSAALATGVPKVVHTSSIVVFGNTNGAVVDEAYRRNDGYTSYYDETKTLAHRVAEGFVAKGLPVVIAQPGQIYGPGDPSGIGAIFRRAAAGKLPVLTFGDLGMSFVHVEVVAGGIVTLIDQLDEELVQTHDPEREDFLVTVFKSEELGFYSDEFEEDDEDDVDR